MLKDGTFVKVEVHINQIRAYLVIYNEHLVNVYKLNINCRKYGL